MTLDDARAELEGRFPDLLIIQAGGWPFQAEGTLHDHPFYFRFRHSRAELRIQGANWFQPLYAATGEYTELCDPDDELDTEGVDWLDGDEFVAALSALIPRLTRAPILWEFRGVLPRDIGVRRAGSEETYGAWGHTPEQAWAAMHEPSPYLRSRGIDDAAQAQMRAERRLDPTTITVDGRVFPDPDPFAKAPA